MTKILDNIWLKITAVILALLVWLHVATEKVYTHRIMLPVNEVIVMDSLTLASQPPDSILVSVSASGKELLRKKWRERGLRISATNFGIGEHILTLSSNNTDLIRPGGDLSIEEIISPAQLRLTIDELATHRVVVRPNFVTEAAEGYAISGPIDLRPDSVTLSGPQSIVRTIESVDTEQRSLSGIRDEITMTVAVSPPRPGISVRPDSVQAHVLAVPVKTRVFEGIPVRIFNVPPDSQITSMPATVRVELTGPPHHIDILEPAAITASVNYRNVDTSGGAPLKIDVPPTFRVKNISENSVRIIARAGADTGN